MAGIASLGDSRRWTFDQGRPDFDLNRLTVIIWKRLYALRFMQCSNAGAARPDTLRWRLHTKRMRLVLNKQHHITNNVSRVAREDHWPSASYSVGKCSSIRP